MFILITAILNNLNNIYRKFQWALDLGEKFGEKNKKIKVGNVEVGGDALFQSVSDKYTYHWHKTNIDQVKV